MEFRSTGITGMLAAAASVTALGSSAGCDRAMPAQRHALTGVVMAIDAERHTLTVAHEAIPDLMPAMTMPFSVRGVWPTQQINDRIAATLVMTETQSWLENVSTVARGSTSTVSGPAGADSALVGTRVPDVRLVNHDGQPLAIRDLAGSVVLVTFIYTRCPLPDYCPRLMRNLAEVRRTLEARPTVQRQTTLLAVTLDPEFDTPSVLRAYGERVFGGRLPSGHVTMATGPIAETQALSGFFGIGYRANGSTIDHAVGAAIIGADGRVAAVLSGAQWRADEALALIEREVDRVRKE